MARFDKIQGMSEGLRTAPRYLAWVLIQTDIDDSL